MRNFNRLNLISAIILFCSCGGNTTAIDSASCQLKDAPKHVIVVGFDGFSAASIRTEGSKLPDAELMPTLRMLMENGSYTLENRSVLPSSSAVNWASMWMGAGPELHGYTRWNSRTPDLPSRVLTEHGIFPDVFAMVRKAHPEAEIGYIYEWDGMRYLIDTLAVDFIKQADLSGEDIEQSISPAVGYIKEKKPNLCAVIFAQPDNTGHSIGWSTPEYFAMLKHLDKVLAAIVRAVDEAGIMDETVIIVTADHGGLGTNHGGITMEEMQTPLVFYGKGIRKGYVIQESSMVYDVAGSIGYMMGIRQPQVWIARPLLSVFECSE